MTLETRTPDLIGMIGEPGLLPAIDEELFALAPFDLSCVFVYPSVGKPVLAYDGFRGWAAPEVLERYLEGAYLLDCVYSACKHRVAAGLHRLSDIAPDAFFEGEYYNSPEVHPCISAQAGSLAEEIVYIVPLKTGATAAYSLMRGHGGRPFAETEMADLRRGEAVVRALLAKQFADLGEDSTAVAALEDRFDQLGGGVLSQRERAIVALILQGHSSRSVGLRLGIAEGTVKIHRKNIHAKLGISSQAELFALFLTHVRGA
jgi:DNA-binding CsgD family transcriptional regulator